MKIEVEMSEITPETKVKLSLAALISGVMGVASAVVLTLQFFGVINIGNAQIVDPITKTEIESTYVKKEKLQDTVNLVEFRIQSLEKQMRKLEETMSKNQDKMDDKLDKILDKISKP